MRIAIAKYEIKERAERVQAFDHGLIDWLDRPALEWRKEQLKRISQLQDELIKLESA